MKKLISFVLSTAMLTGVCSSVAYADNAPMESLGVVEDYDFENYDVQDFTKKGTFLDGKIRIDSIAAGDSIGIIEEADGNKALKITRKKENAKATSAKFLFVFDKAYNGKITVNFDVKIGNDNGGCASFCGFGSETTENGYENDLNNRLYGDYWWAKGSGTEQWTNKWDWGTGWFPMEMTMDFSTGTFSGTAYRFKDGSYSKRIDKTWNFTTSNVKYMCLAAIGSGSVNASITDDAVYYFDNIRVTEYKMKQMAVENISVGDTPIKINDVVNIEMNEAVADESINKDCFAVYSGDKKVDSYEVSKDSTGKIISLAGIDGWEYNTEYNIVISKNIAAVRGQVKNMNEDYSVKFKTESLIDGCINIKDGDRYNHSAEPQLNGKTGVEYVSELRLQDGDFQEYNYEKIDKIGNYELKITAKANGKTEERSIKFTVLGDIAPTAVNAEILGDVVFGAEITGSYTFKDENGDAEGVSTYRWLVSDKIDGVYSPINGETKKTLEIDEKIYDKYIKFEVTAVSLNAPYSDDSSIVTSEAVKGLFRPVAKNVSIKAEGKVLKAEYEYFDENNDDKSEPVYKWYKSETKDGNYKQIEGAVSQEFTLTDEHNSCFIAVGITPKSVNIPKEGKEAMSEVFIAPFKPSAEDLKIIGEVKAGQTIGAEYKYTDENGDEEGNSIITWYVDGSRISTGDSLYLEQSYARKSMYFTVTPVSKQYPENGDPVKSTVYNVKEAGKISSSGGSSGGGGGGKGTTLPGNVSNTPQKDNNTQENNQTEETNNTTGENVFSDIINHWAEKDITELYEMGMVSGVSADEYKPDRDISRAEAAILIARLLKLENGNSQFKDVMSDDWYYGGISSVAEAGIFVGADGYFRPTEKITREELCTVIARIIEMKEIKFENKDFSFNDEASISSWAVSGIKTVYSLGIIQGMDDGAFAPKENATRAQTAVIINKLIKIIGGEENE